MAQARRCVVLNQCDSFSIARSDERLCCEYEWFCFLSGQWGYLLIINMRRASGIGVIAIFAILLMLPGCSSTGLSKIAAGTLELVGLAKPEEKAPPKEEPPREIPLQVFAGSNLNADARGRPIAVVVKVYKLRNNASFLAAPYESLADTARERDAIGQDLIEVRELALTPGQKLEFREKLSSDTAFLAVVALFRSPAPDRWRYTFPVDASNAKGVNVGVHACALTVSLGSVSGAKVSDVQSLSGVRCNP